MIGTATSIFGHEVDTTFLVLLVGFSVILCAIVFTTLYFLFKYGSRRNPQPEDIPGSAVLETAWTVVPVIIVLAIFFYGWSGYRELFDPPDDALEVNVTARQWSWLFEYDGGVSSSELLRLPAGRAVRLNLSSTDVIHSLYIPAFRVKADVVPGLKDRFVWFTPDEAGTYDLFCTEYCGTGHSRMISRVEVVEGAEFDAWLSAEADKLSTRAGHSETGLQAGRRLVVEKGCTGCHTTDGSPLIGPSWKGTYLSRGTVTTGGVEREVTKDEAYIRNSILEPQSDVVEGFPPIMPPQRDQLTDKELESIVEYIKSLK